MTDAVLKAVSKASLERIEMQRDAMRAYVTDNYIRLHPECCALIPEHRLRKICKEDLG